eukprot:1934273-Ditylum_brightwellii.AAC.1
MLSSEMSDVKTFVKTSNDPSSSMCLIVSKGLGSGLRSGLDMAVNPTVEFSISIGEILVSWQQLGQNMHLHAIPILTEYVIGDATIGLLLD